MDCAPLDMEGSQTGDVGSTEGERLADAGWPRARVGDLEADGEVADEQAEADGDLIGVQAGADEVVKVVAVDQLVERLLHAPALAIQRSECPRPDRAQAGGVDPRPALIARGTRAEGDEPPPLV